MKNTLIKKNQRILENIIVTDQQAIKDFRNGKISISEHIEINKKNVAVVKKIISEIGFPTVRLTSQKAYKAAVLVVLHSGDLELLKQSISDLQIADPLSVEKRDIAFMIDKSRVIQNLPQLYGTQYYFDKNHIIKYIDVENPQDLEKRRSQLGMEKYEEYKKIVEQNANIGSERGGK